MSAAEIIKPSRFQIRAMIRDKLLLTPESQKVINDCVTRSYDVWAGVLDEDVYCVWGVIPPTILSNKAYLWLYTNQDRVSTHQFIFIRKSQIAVQQMLEKFEVLYGTVDVRYAGARRWLKWLGAEFQLGLNGQLEFRIRRK